MKQLLVKLLARLWKLALKFPATSILQSHNRYALTSKAGGKSKLLAEVVFFEDEES